jgi:hypothetical protein
MSAASGVLAQGRPETAADPIRCWWRTSRAAVAIGEPFEASLTCAVREHESVRTVADESRLGAAVIQLAPFEILGGSHPADLRTASHRFFQYHYSLRIIDSDAIGRDARFPDIQIAYRVHTRVNGEWAEGRDRSYIMPGQLIRVLSLVPLEAEDIRDSGPEDFARVTGLRFRARALRIGAVALILFGAIIALPAGLMLIRRGRPTSTPDEGAVSPRVVLTAARRELVTIAQDSRAGWTPDLSARLLGTLRLIASCAIKRPVSQRAVSVDAAPAGRVMTTVGVLRRRPIALSSAVTPLDVDKALAALPLTARHEHRHQLEELLQALIALTRATYGTSFDAQNPALDQSLAAATAAARQVRGRA